ncbi:hypothetical protein SJA_C2-02560 [Sphingobium indicum UT26S]|uniref:Uncharacterized protein n=1 Tax=Sphingobium indicum (strain DSM 16413 / CCM 7287 / MTCC 6362 / UT26 / NBRC 101211 / UT26S) TaxID=452662 RepID=D4Z800_SPHIU|nr:hypothetical protein SJA_C2-02560 [Sphingobium indicum UT26S]
MSMRSTAQCTPQRAIQRTTTTIRNINTPGLHQGRRSAESSVGRQRRGPIIVRCAPELVLRNSSAASRKFRHGHVRRRVLHNQPARQPAFGLGEDQQDQARQSHPILAAGC